MNDVVRERLRSGRQTTAVGERIRARFAPKGREAGDPTDDELAGLAQLRDDNPAAFFALPLPVRAMVERFVAAGTEAE